MSPTAQLDVRTPTLVRPPTGHRVVYLGAHDLRADPAPLNGWSIDLALITDHGTRRHFRVRVADRYLDLAADGSGNERVWRTLAYLGARQIQERTTAAHGDFDAHCPEPVDLFPLVALARDV